VSPEFGNRMGKPPDRGKRPGELSLEEYLTQSGAGTSNAGSRAHPDEQPQPPPPFAQPAAAAELAQSGDGGGGQKPPRTLRSVDAPEPPDEGPPPTTKEGAEVERQRVETDKIRAQNEGIRSDTGIKEEKAVSEIEIKEQKATSEIKRAESRAEIEDEALEVDTEMTRRERFFFMRVTAVGLLIIVVSPIVAGLAGQPLYFGGGGVGLLVTGGGLRRLSVLASPQRQKACFLRKRKQEDQRGQADHG
jgi:hypothetical protein